ncbi:MAG: EscU/YscU/HrcU family type III secretion system export apparatus switch protein [Planctomycetes bacterium]|nr:EscU/YscU/HrcU family type III secretion system export apparatus switch protein [Planctomycetota bacterium]
MAGAGEDRDQRTEEATPRRLHEARQSGKAPYSQEFAAAIAALAGMVSILLCGPRLIEALGRLLGRFIERLQYSASTEWGPNDAVALVLECLFGIGLALMAVIGPILAASAFAAWGQVGFVIAGESVGINPARLDPSANLSKVFSLRSLTKLSFGFAHLFVIGAVGTYVLWRGMPAIIATSGGEVGPFLVALGALAWKLGLWVLGTGLALALFDVFYQRWQHAKDLRMTKDEVKREHKSSEGDPHVKARIRQIQREVSRRRMMQDVPKATVVVTNPTHVAVALSYPRGENGEPLFAAPRVVAKGFDLVAERIKGVAVVAGVPLHEDVRLARALHRRVEIGSEVPEDLYTAVAEVLNYVYRVQQVARAG